MFTPLGKCALYDALKGINPESAGLTREITPQEWVCYLGDYTLVVRYLQGLLGLGVGEADDKVYVQMVILGTDDDRTDNYYRMIPIAFNEVLAFMGWEIDEDRCVYMNAGKLPLQLRRAAATAAAQT